MKVLTQAMAESALFISQLSNSVMKNLRLSRASLVSATLVGSWRKLPPLPVGISEAQLDAVTPLLCASGAAALGWWRIRQTNLSATPSAEVLHQAYRIQALQSAIHEKKIEKIFRLLRQASVDAILVKGWLAAGLYPDRALRPYGDIDLCFRREHFHTAKDILASSEAKDCWVDPHLRFSELESRSFEELFARSKLVDLGTEKIRIMGAEDHLALLAVHLLKHGAWRPLWLCDIGAAIESLPKEFSWDVCLGGNKTRALWVICAIHLSQELLDADIHSLPKPYRLRKLPRWLVSNVLRQWAAPFAINQPPMSHPAPMASYLKTPKGLLKGLRARWPNPIIATVSVNGEFNDLPRLPYQIGNCALRTAEFFFPRANTG